MGASDQDLVADILIAIDDETLSTAVTQELTSRSGVRTISAASDDDLLTRLGNERFDALIISEVFCGLIYQGLVSLIRSGDLCVPNLPIVLIANYGAAGLDDIGQRYFVKALSPTDISSAAHAVQRAISERPRPVALLIDDNDQFLTQLKEDLEPSFRVVTTSTPESAAALFQIEKPDIVVSDYSMPFRDGESVARELRSLGPDTPIVILTAHDTPRNHIALTKAGITRFFSKKMARQELERAFRELVLERAIAKASKAAALEATATGRLVRAIQAARADLGVGRAAFAAERLKGALMRNLTPTIDDDQHGDDDQSDT